MSGKEKITSKGGKVDDKVDAARTHNGANEQVENKSLESVKEENDKIWEVGIWKGFC